MLFCFCLCCFRDWMCNVVKNWLEVLALGRFNSFLAQRSFILNEERNGKKVFQALKWIVVVENFELGKKTNLKILSKNNNECCFQNFSALSLAIYKRKVFSEKSFTLKFSSEPKDYSEWWAFSEGTKANHFSKEPSEKKIKIVFCKF